VPETISDTGPVLHLHEIGQLATLTTVAPVVLPDLVLAELETRGLDLAQLGEMGVESMVSPVPTSEWEEILRNLAPQIQPADAQVFALARASRFQALALTDDLSLRRLLESHGAPVTGTVGILIRAYTSSKISRWELDAAIESLFNDSSLHLSSGFRAYLRKLLEVLP
jgi:predicted nucleic acid-binding protein